MLREIVNQIVLVALAGTVAGAIAAGFYSESRCPSCVGWWKRTGVAIFIPLWVLFLGALVYLATTGTLWKATLPAPIALWLQ